MPRIPPRSTCRPARLAALACAAALAALALPSHALYKIVGPDGRVTYTDRPQAPGKVTSMQPDGRLDAQVVLPRELQQATARFPVTLYVTSNCDPCEAARSLLRRRGVPHQEKQVVSQEDSRALAQLTGGSDTPVLQVGSQILRGLSATVWGSYLDSAGYPRESRLPGNYRYPEPSPLVELRKAEPAPQPAPTGLPSLPMASPPGAGGIRF